MGENNHGDSAADPGTDATLAVPTPEKAAGRDEAHDPTVASPDPAAGPTAEIGPPRAASTAETAVAAPRGSRRKRERDHAELPVVRREVYAMDRELARGGMGRISIARDRRMARVVAVKELLPGHPESAPRFEREAILTGQLQHPGIVPIYEAGHWGSGDPFFSMKWVDGRPLNKVIAETENLEQRLALLPSVIAVADALAYAHSRGVIHRDIKPANILLGSFGETVVIDWGLGKALGEEGIEDGTCDSVDASDPGLTMAGTTMGTPTYMPPEQAAGETVGPPADVYAVGAVLYHLLAGVAPYHDSEATNVQEFLEQVREERPRALREIEPGVPADLSTIVEKAMAHSPDDRYPTAAELVEDLKRFETGKLVGAHAYSLAALLRRWIRRHRAAITVAGVLLVALAILAVASVRRITAERNRAEREQQLAAANRAEVEELLDFMLVDLRKKLRPVGKLELLDTVAQRATRYFSERDIDFADPADARRRAIAFNNLGSVLRERGDLEGALEHFRRGLKIVQRLVDEHPTNWRFRADLSTCHRNVGSVLELQRDLPGAAEQYRAALGASEAVLAAAPDDPAHQRGVSVAHNDLGDILLREQKPADALRYYRQALAVRERLAAEEPNDEGRLRDLSVSHGKVGAALERTGDLDAALEQYRAASAASERAVELSPEDVRAHRDHAIDLARIGDILYKKGDADGALEMYRAVVAARQRLAELDPSNARWRRDLGLGHGRLGQALAQRGDLDGGLAEYRSFLQISEKLAAEEPGNSTWRSDLTFALNRVGAVLWAKGARTDALPYYRRVVSIGEELVEAAPDDPSLRLDLAFAQYVLGRALHLTGNAREAAPLLASCTQAYRDRGTTKDDAYQGALCAALGDRPDDAFALLDRAVDLGYDDREALEADDDLVSLRRSPRWKALLERSELGPR